MTDQPTPTDDLYEPTYTIEECLNIADDYLKIANEGEILELAVGHAAIAAAFAQVATAKMAYETHKVWHTDMDETFA